MKTAEHEALKQIKEWAECIVTRLQFASLDQVIVAREIAKAIQGKAQAVLPKEKEGNHAKKTK